MSKKQSKYFKSPDKVLLKENEMFGRINVVQQEDLPENINIKKVLNNLEKIIPEHFLENLDSIYIGNYDFLIDRDLNAVYQDAAIYLMPHYDSEEDLFDDLVHEIAHCVEENFLYDIYEDSLIETEFLKKRKKLLDILRAYDYDGIDEKEFYNTEYSQDFDEYLYIMIGYPVLTQLSNGIFVTPYGATSMREYFANCFEQYFAKRNYKEVRAISPAVFKKIEFLLSKF